MNPTCSFPASTVLLQPVRYVVAPSGIVSMTCRIGRWGMNFNVDEIVKLVQGVGLFAVVSGVLVWAVFLPRKSTEKDADGKPVLRASFLSPGWILDQARADARVELETQRQFYQKALADCQKDRDDRIAAERGARDVALADAADAKSDRAELIKSINDLARDVAVLLEVQRMAEGIARREASRGG